jgi:hypothetical protein
LTTDPHGARLALGADDVIGLVGSGRVGFSLETSQKKQQLHRFG